MSALSALLSRFSVALYTIVALVAFAANSVLCRMALASNQYTIPLIDPSSFTAIRLTAGALVLWLLMLLRSSKADVSQSDTKNLTHHGSVFAAVLLFIYAVTFSYAYVLLDTATGALILFAAVQISMMLISYFQGHRLSLLEWLGALLAFAGFGYLVLPGVSAPSIIGLVLMAVSGCAWGGYTLLGKQSRKPLFDTGYNFIRTLPLVLVMIVVVWWLPVFSASDAVNHFTLSPTGILLAILSGGAASGVGYALWYQALRGLTSTHAAVLQLTVPVIAALGGVLFLDEVISIHLSISASIIFLGIALVILAKPKSVRLNKRTD
ncbi:DMT family transporter [Shewanella livingstonensis]|uniref:DMT family transporter n=1 Tax=Shewanella livingstonensis TaxID=150120 RepID=A0A3G8LYV9_9GAMM|nr:DMT family transporter [Shewanella livingstonensis]AZG73878.1 DMT family transporter [Shewanella livingstonensis]